MPIGSIKTILDRLSNADESELLVEYREVNGNILLDLDTVAKLAGLLKSGGEFALNDSNGKRNTSDAYTVTTSTYTGGIRDRTDYLRKALVEMFDAAGNDVGAANPSWEALVPSQLQADGAGAVTATDMIAALGAGVAIDFLGWLQVSTSGSYLLDFVEDATGTPAVTIPDYHTSPVSLYMVAGYLYTVHIRATTDNVSLGWNNMANGSWPNSSYMTLTGHVRAV